MKKNRLYFIKTIVLLLAIFVGNTTLNAQCFTLTDNGNFETGDLTGWQQPSYSIVTGNAPISGNYSGLSGDFTVANVITSPPAYSRLYKIIQVPASGGILSFSYQCTRSGYSSATTQRVYISDPNSPYIGLWATVFYTTWSNAGGTVTYNLAPFAGKSIALMVAVDIVQDNLAQNSQHYTMAAIKIDDVKISTKTSILTFNECQLGFSHAVGNHIYTNYGTYCDTVNSNGCDSIINTTITKKYERANQYIFFCQGSTVTATIGNHTYTSMGTYVDTLVYLNNCDSILTTTLAYSPEPTVKRAFSSCGNFTFNSGNIVHTVSGAGVHNYIDTLFGGSMYGCDSVIYTEVTINTTPAPAAQVANRVLCNGQTSSKIAFNLPDSTTFTKWHSSNPAIGLKAMGVDTIPQFVAINNSSIPIIDTITVVVKGRGIAWIPSGNRMYKYDLSTKAVVDSAIIPGGKIVHTVAFDHTGSTVYAVGNTSDFINNRRERSIFAFSANTGEFLRTYKIINEVPADANEPIDGNMCVSPDNKYLYLTVNGKMTYDWHFEKIDLATGVVKFYDSLSYVELNLPHGPMCFSPDGSKVYIGTASSGLREYNMPDFTYSRTLNAVSGYSIICSPDGKRLFVGRGINSGNATIRVVDIAADTLITTLTTPAGYPDGVEGAFSYTPDSTRLVVCYSNLLPVMSGVNNSRFYSYDINTYQFNNVSLGGQYGNLQQYDQYDFGRSYHNGFVTPDGRDMMIHEPAVFNNGYFGMMYRKLGSTGAFTNANTSLTNNGTNLAGSFGDLVDIGHCESQVMTFTITINPTKFTNQVTICSGDTFKVGSKGYTSSGTYLDTLQGASIYGCDSIVTTILTVKPSTTYYQAFSYCGSGSVTVGNVTHTTTGYYADTLHAASSTGCDSIVFTNLIINPLPAAPNITVSNQAGCPGATIAATNLGSGSNGSSIVWSGTTTAIGLAATGTSTVPAFTAINNTSNAIIDTISVTSTATGYAYVANPNFSYVAVINRQSNTVVSNIGSLSGASGVAINRNGSRVYVSGNNVNTVSVINASTNTVSNTITVGSQPFNVAVNPAGNRVYSANSGSNNVSVIDTLTNTVIATIPVKLSPRGIVVHPDGKRLYVANSGSDTVSVINTVSNTVIANIPVADNPFSMVVNAAGNRVYTANFTSGTVSVINAEKNTLITNIAVGSTARGIAITPDGTRLYVTDFLDNKVYVVNTATNTLTATITVGVRPTGISISADGTRAYVTNSTGPTVSVISTASNTVIATIGSLSGPDTQGNFVSGSGCSSAPVKYTITVNPIARKTQNISLCAGNSITVGTHTYNSAGTYIDTLSGASINGCDSIITTVLTIQNNVTSTVTTSICQGSSYAGHTTSGTYVDHYTNVNGCDSARTLNLTVKPNATSTITISVCQGSSYAGHTTSGTYIDHYTSANGCDSARTLNLTVKPNVTSTVTTSICQGSSYAGHTASGTYVDHYTSANGCDSARTLNLTVNPNVTSTVTIAICQGSSYAGHTTSGTYVDHYTSAAGCDSARTLNLTVKPNVTSTVTTAICQGSSYAGHTTSGTYVDHYTSAAGCDSARTLNLTVNPNVTSNVTLAICQGSSYAGHTTTGTYVDHYTSAAGCDSARTLNLTVKPNVTSTVTTAICQGSSYAGHTTSGTYVDHYTSANGCDSTRTLNLTVNQPSSSTSTITICPSQLPYVWNGLTFNSAGTQTKTGLVNAAGCDSSATLNLAVNAVSSSTTNLSICRSELPYTWNGLTFTTAGSQTATGFTSTAGCDSTATLNLTVNDTSHAYFNYSICESAMPLSWNNITITAPGTYTKTGFTNMYGCDSSITMYFTTRPSTSSTTNTVICESQLPYTWNGLVFNGSGTQTKTGLQNSVYCDSTATLNLTVIPAVSVTNITICQSQLPYIWNGLTFNTAGTQTATGFTNINGCDSSATLILTVNNTVTGTEVVTACNSYTWIDGNTYTTSNNTATHTLTNTAGCDSVVTLNLTINNSSNGTDVVSACDSYTWIDGNTYTANNTTATHTLTNAAGCDSVVTLNLTINNSSNGTDVVSACGSYTWIDGNTYTASNNTATFVLAGSNGCDSIVTLNLQVTQLSKQATVAGAVCSAVESNALYQWINCSTKQHLTGATSQTYTATQNGSYACIVEKNNCTDTTDCVNVTTIGISNPSAYFFKVFPNPTNGLFTVEHNYPAASTIQITDALGRIVGQFNLQASTTYVDISYLASGIYNCSIVSNSEQLYKLKIIKE
ncbi:MAG: T9SS type A sorting domain-containing protein [Chitinophagales bacterium]